MRPDDLTPSAKLRHAAAILERRDATEYELDLARRYVMEVGMDWQPIETAPKAHGREILVCERHRTMAVVCWLDQGSLGVEDQAGFVSGWYISDGHNDPIWYRNWLSLTHWMPLPSPPDKEDGI
jgi:hypothetical protein